MRAWADKLLASLQQAQPGHLETTWKKYSAKKLLRASLFVDDYIRRVYPTCPAALNPRQLASATSATANAENEQ